MSPGLQLAQSGHAIVEWIHRHRHQAWRWHAESNNLVVLDGGDLEALQARLAELTRTPGVDPVAFSEPDLGGELTAVAVSGSGAGRALANIPLAGRSMATV